MAESSAGVEYVIVAADAIGYGSYAIGSDKMCDCVSATD